jgi:hypothetical protein
MALVFEELPEKKKNSRPKGTISKGGRQDWPAIAAELKENPGEWAIIDRDCLHTSASNYKRGRNNAFSQRGRGSSQPGMMRGAPGPRTGPIK